VRFQGAPIPLIECAFHPSYASAGPNDQYPRNGNDLALCRLKDPVNGITMETVDGDPLERSTGVVLMGFGCAALEIKNGKLHPIPDPPGDEVLRLGDQSIEATGLSLQSSGNLLARTISVGSQPTICPGDSGGPVFTRATEATVSKSRRISGVNSAMHGQWGTHVKVPKFHSYLAPISSSFRSWAETWANQRSLVICGIQRPAGLDGCRR
jgi:hypothetical protein